MGAKRNKKYLETMSFLEKHLTDHVILSIRYHSNWLIFGKIIQLAARLKGREPYAHTAYIIYYKERPFVYEFLARGINIHPLEYYFIKRFKGKVVSHLIPSDLTYTQRHEQWLHLKSLQMQNRPNVKYSVLRAMGAWFDWGKDQKKNPEINYCTESVLEEIDRVDNKKLYLNTGEVTPAENAEHLKSIYASRVLIDTKKV